MKIELGFSPAQKNVIRWGLVAGIVIGAVGLGCSGGLPIEGGTAGSGGSAGKDGGAGTGGNAGQDAGAGGDGKDSGVAGADSSAADSGVDSPADSGVDSSITDTAVEASPICTPNDLKCAGPAQNLVMICDPKGQAWTTLQKCSGKQLCDTSPGSSLGSCQDPVTVCIGKLPGDKVCDGNKAVKCGPDLVTSEDTPCQNQTCVAGVCQGECSPGLRCDGLVPQTCNAQGSWSSAAACPYACVNGACADCVPCAVGYVCESHICAQSCANGRYLVLDPGSAGCGLDGSGRVKDTTSNLTWMRRPFAYPGVQQPGAAAYCLGKGMRLPTRAEAHAIAGVYNDKCAFPCTWGTWTSTPGGSGNAWYVDYNSAEVEMSVGTNADRSICVLP